MSVVASNGGKLVFLRTVFAAPFYMVFIQGAPKCAFSFTHHGDLFAERSPQCRFPITGKELSEPGWGPKTSVREARSSVASRFDRTHESALAFLRTVRRAHLADPGVWSSYK
jgi:hypothetical protein